MKPSRMILGSALLFVGVSLAGSQQAPSGQWEGELALRRQRAGEPRLLWLDLEAWRGQRRHRQHFGFMAKVSDLSGLPADDPRWSGAGLRFELRRDAGVLAFQGSFENGLGEGTYSFTPHRGFLQGLDVGGVRALDDDDLLAMAIHDVNRAWVRGLGQAGVRDLDADKLLAMRIHGVSPEFVTDVKAQGYAVVDSDELVAMRIHGVTPEFIREVTARSQERPSLDDLMAYRIHGVTPEFTRELERLGYREVDPDDLVAMRIHGVDARFIGDLDELGYQHPDLDQLVAMRIHGVSPTYIRSMAGAGYPGISIDRLLEFRIHGVDAAFVEDMRAKGYRDLSARDLVDLKIHGGRRRHRGSRGRGAPKGPMGAAMPRRRRTASRSTLAKALRRPRPAGLGPPIVPSSCPRSS